MKKIFLSIIFFLFFFIAIIISYLSIIGYETKRFNSILEKKISSSTSNIKVDLNKIKIKVDIKKFSFFITTLKPSILYHNNKVDLNKINAYIDFKSLIIGKPKIKNVHIVSNEISITRIKNVVKYFKPSNFKKFFLNNAQRGSINFILDLSLKDNKIFNYEINGKVKNFYTDVQNMNLKKASFIYSIKENSGEANNIRGLINGFQINSGIIEFDNSDSLKIKGNLKSNFNLRKEEANNLYKKKIFEIFENFNVNGKIQSVFAINFDKTLKVDDYKLEASGDVKNSIIKFKKPKKYIFVKNQIQDLDFKNTEFKINYNKEKNKTFRTNGFYKINNNKFQKFDLNYSLNSNLQRLLINGDFDNEITIPFLNYTSKNTVVNINSDLEFHNNTINLKKLSLTEGKNKININNLFIKNNKLLKFDNISVKTFTNAKYNNDFVINLGNKINVNGYKYDASNLTKLLTKSNNVDFMNNINKEIAININEIATDLSEVISNFKLIGYIEKGKFNKIVSKGEFEDGKYLDISLRVDKDSKKKVLEVYSDLPKPLLSNYKFFDGLSGGQLLLFSSYDSQNSNTNLSIENFKVKDAPGLVKLLSLADFGGMVDALSGDGLSFEKLEMTMDKNNQVLNLKELYAIGPSISILMEGYVESKTDLVSLRGTMVPAKTLNKFLSKLPIVGDILIPKEIGEGLFGISFKMKGTPGKIKTTVNPIKTLTPRFIQKALKRPK